MKKYLLLIAIVASAISCKKTEVKPGLFGKWELRQASAGGDYVNEAIIYKPGNGNIYQFNSDSTYKAYVNHTLISQGIFHIRINTDATIATIEYVLLNDNVSYPIGIDGTSMMLITTSNLPREKYQKISN